MNPQQNTQPQNSQLTPNQAMGNLGFINTMQEQLLQHKARKAGIQPKTAPSTAPQPQGQEKPQETTKPSTDENEAKMTKLELDMTKKIDDLRKELDDKHKLEIDKLRNDITEALQEDEQK